MDNKKALAAMAILFVVILSWQAYVQLYVRPHHPEWDWTNGQGRTAATQQSDSTTSSGSSMSDASTHSDSGSIEPSSSPSDQLQTVGAATQPSASTQPFVTTIGSIVPKDPDFHLGVETVADGAGLQSVVVNIAKSVNAKEIYSYQQPYKDNDEWRSLAARSLNVDGKSANLLVPWKIEVSTTTSVSYGLDIMSATGKPMLHLTKIYHLSPTALKAGAPVPSDGYVLNVTYQIHNLSSATSSVSMDFNGPTMPPREIERSDDRNVVSGYEKADHQVEYLKDTLSEFKVGAVTKDLSRSSSGNPVLWAGESSVYFSAIVRPEDKSQIAQITAKALNPEEALPENRLLVLDFTTSQLAIKPGATVEIPLEVFLGPMDRAMLEKEYYGDYPRAYRLLLATSSGFCGMCAFPWLVDLLVDVLKFFHLIFRDWGLSIIVLVIAVRVILHPIAKKSQVSMLGMQKLAPEIDRLKKKFGDDKEGFAKAQMELYKGMGATPILGCLPMLLQMPIWYALYSALQSEYNLRQAPFLYGFTWIHDLAQPDQLITWPTHAFTLPLLGTIASLNVLPLVMALVMFIQQKTTPQPPAMTPEQESQRKMMQYMSLVFSVFFYHMPSGLNLYILTSSTLAIFESKIIRDHLKKKKEEEESQRVIIDAKPTRMGKQIQQDAAKPGAISAKGCAPGWWANMQKRIEEIQREAEKRNKRK